MFVDELNTTGVTLFANRRAKNGKCKDNRYWERPISAFGKYYLCIVLSPKLDELYDLIKQ